MDGVAAIEEQRNGELGSDTRVELSSESRLGSLTCRGEGRVTVACESFLTNPERTRAVLRMAKSLTAGCRLPNHRLKAGSSSVMQILQRRWLRLSTLLRRCVFGRPCFSWRKTGMYILKCFPVASRSDLCLTSPHFGRAI